MERGPAPRGGTNFYVRGPGEPAKTEEHAPRRSRRNRHRDDAEESDLAAQTKTLFDKDWLSAHAPTLIWATSPERASKRKGGGGGERRSISRATRRRRADGTSATADAMLLSPRYVTIPPSVAQRSPEALLLRSPTRPSTQHPPQQNCKISKLALGPTLTSTASGTL